MGFGDTNKITYTNVAGQVPQFIVNAKILDNKGNEDGLNYWYFEDAAEKFGYYFSIPEINSAANSLATWAFGRGWTTEDNYSKQELEHVKGMGQDTFDTIMYNHEIVKLVVGDAFMEIVREGELLLNLIPISPERVRIAHKDGQIKHYDVFNGKEWKKLSKEKMFHSSNKRIGDQVHGTSQIDACKWVIDARNEALLTNRMIEQRGRALGIVYYKTNAENKINFANQQIEKAVARGEMLGVPEEAVKIEDFPNKPLAERLGWISYLENFFYQTFGVPRTIATSDGVSEVGGKMGHVIFEPVYTKEQKDAEQQIDNYLGIILTFNRPPSLGGLVAQEEAKNTGQINLQPNDATATLQRE